MDKVINIEELNDAVLIIEEALKPYNEVEKELIFNQYINKRQMMKAKQRQGDLIGSVNFKDVLKQVMGGKDKEEL